MSYEAIADPDTGAGRRDLVRRCCDSACIPADPGNIDWQSYQEWLKERYTSAEPDAIQPPRAKKQPAG